MKAILGLGNPGLKYRFSRHNLGFLVVKELSQQEGIRLSQKRAHCLLGEGLVGRHCLLLGLPTTFMNLSGQAASAIVRQKRVALSDLLVVCDDINLPLGKMRLRSKGSDGGHQGLRSIIQSLGSNDFARLRIGVGRAQGRVNELSQYVLENFSKKEMKVVQEAITEALSCARAWLEHGIHYAMNKFN